MFTVFFFAGSKAVAERVVTVMVESLDALGSASVDLSDLRRDEAEVIAQIAEQMDGVHPVMIKMARIVADTAKE